MTATEKSTTDEWAKRWLNSVADGTLTMSQRKLSSVSEHGGLERVSEVARSVGVHLAIVTDDHGDELVIASVHPIQVLC